jgi:hypothetical protein
MTAPALFSLALAGLAASAAAADKPAQVDGVVVVAGPGPKVTASFPADGASVAAGGLVLKVVFDQPMAADAWSYGRSAAGAFPACLARPRLLADQRTYVLLCTVAPRRSYAVALNAAPAFASAQGRSAKPFLLRFSTADVGVRNVHDALVQAGLTDADEPIMSWRDDGKGVSRSPPPDDGDVAAAAAP